MVKARAKIFSGAAYGIWQEPLWAIKDFQKSGQAEKLNYLCRFAHMAPSSHNTQPWRFFCNDKALEIELYLDRNFVLPVSDVVGRQGVISLGCALENLKIAAGYYRLKFKIVYSDVKASQVLPLKPGKSPARYVELAKISFMSGANVETGSKDLLQALVSRKVMRAEFDPTIDLPSSLKKDLEQACAERGVKLISLSSPVRRLALSEFQGQADGYVINSPKFARELGQWLLPNNSPGGLGMPGVGFGLKDEQALRLHKGLCGLAALEPEDGLRFALGGKTALEKSPFIGLITVSRDDPSSWIKAGRALSMSLILLEKAGFSAAIHAAVVEVTLVSRMFTASLSTGNKLAAVFRAGKLKDKNNASRPHSPRVPLAEVILGQRPD